MIVVTQVKISTVCISGCDYLHILMHTVVWPWRT